MKGLSSDYAYKDGQESHYNNLSFCLLITDYIYDYEVRTKEISICLEATGLKTSSYISSNICL